MKVSIVTISYNQARFLEETIISVIEQDYPDIEYIVVDPGSTDGSREIIERYRSKISHILLEPDSGPADGLNKGFYLATGNIFGFINSDDFYLKSTINKIVQYFRNHQDIDVLSGNAHVINSKNEILRYTYSDKFSLISCAYGFSNLIQPSTFFRAESFNKTRGFNTKNKSNWDGELFVDMKLNQAKFGRINEYLSAYRIYESSITGSRSLEEKIKDYSDSRFFKIMNRKRNRVDNLWGHMFRLYRYITNGRDLSQRIRFGPIYGRYSISQKVKK